jgi:hypothetical protein
VRIAKNKSDRMSKPLSAIHHVTDVVLGPGEDSSTGNVTGGRKLARYVLERVVRAVALRPYRTQVSTLGAASEKQHYKATQRRAAE